MVFIPAYQLEPNGDGVAPINPAEWKCLYCGRNGELLRIGRQSEGRQPAIRKPRLYGALYRLSETYLWSTPPKVIAAKMKCRLSSVYYVRNKKKLEKNDDI